MLPFLTDRERFAIIIQTSDLLEDLIMSTRVKTFREMNSLTGAMPPRVSTDSSIFPVIFEFAKFTLCRFPACEIERSAHCFPFESSLNPVEREAAFVGAVLACRKMPSIGCEHGYTPSARVHDNA
jgi:hypothetical protein